MKYILFFSLALLIATTTSCKDTAHGEISVNTDVADKVECCEGVAGKPSRTNKKLTTPNTPTPQNVTLTTVPQKNNETTLTPIARYDVVPHQRFSRGEIFYFGVVAFSKSGINRVEFTISGQGYSGLNPSVTSRMNYNPRTEVWEYWIPIRASDFSGNGVFCVHALVYGNDSGMRDLGELPLVVNATGKLPRPKVWVDEAGGRDADGELGNKAMPFATVGAAVEAIRSLNEESADGAVIYLLEGNYDLDGVAASTVNEWLTITRAAGAAKENTIISEGGAVQATKLLKISGVTLESSGSYDSIFNGDGNPEKLWIHNCRINGSGQWIEGSNPVNRSSFSDYWTDSYITNTDFGVCNALIARGMIIKNIGNDAFQNTSLIVNGRVDGIDPGDTYWHANACHAKPSNGAPLENQIVYNLFGTDLHYQGLYQSAASGKAKNNAFVNIFIEMRPPGRSGAEDGDPVLSSGAFYGNWDHLLVWHCSFPTSSFYFAEEESGYGFTNSSFVGNIFWEFREYQISLGSCAEPEYAKSDNDENNAFLYNHFMNVFGKTSSCKDGSGSPECPHLCSTIADSGVDDSYTIGLDIVDLNDPNASTFGYPLENSAITDRLPFVKVPVDINNYLRDSMPDIGAFEK